MAPERFSVIQGAVFIATLGGLASACASASLSGAVTGSHSVELSGTKSSSGAEHSRASVPNPPQQMKTAAGGHFEEVTLASGMSACVSERRDLRRVHVSLELSERESPEVLLLLKEWLLSAWSANLEESTSRQECPTALFCGWIPQDSMESALEEWAKIASQPPTQAFFSQLANTRRLAKEWDDNSPYWGLSTAAHFLLEADKSRNITPTEESEEAWTQLVAKNTGHARIAQLGISEMRRAASRLLQTSRLIVAGPSSTSEFLAALSPQNLGQLTSLPEEPAKQQVEPLHYPELLRLQHETDSSRGMLSWRPASSSAEELEVALRVMVARWQDKKERGVQVEVIPASGIDSWPTILAIGSYDAVEVALVEIKAEQDIFLSAAASGQAGEYDRARSAIRANQTLGVEPRCLERTSSPPSAPAEDPSRVALRESVGPVSVIWGTAEAAIQSE